jgi:ribonuclease D
MTLEIWNLFDNSIHSDLLKSGMKFHSARNLLINRIIMNKIAKEAQKAEWLSAPL